MECNTCCFSCKIDYTIIHDGDVSGPGVPYVDAPPGAEAAEQIVEQGQPETLITRGGRFAALVELEAAGWDWQAGPTTSTRS